MSAAPVESRPTHRGTTNRDVRGNTKDRRRRREWVVQTYAADVHIIRVTMAGGHTQDIHPMHAENERHWLEERLGKGISEIDWARQAVAWEVLPTTRCYACGALLTVDTVTCDRIVPGAEGGTYGTPLRDTRDRRTNVRPACSHHNSSTGGRLGAARRAAKREQS